MKNQKDHIDALITHYLNSRYTDLQKMKELEEWIDISKENLQYFMQQLERSFDINVDKNFNFDQNIAYKKFKDRIQSVEIQHKKTSFRFSLLWRYAAAITLLCIISYFSYWEGRNYIKTHFSNIVVEAPIGSKTKLYLPDGTLVWLNSGSSISYSQGFGVDNRKVALEGEGYFEVTHNEKKPFFVRANGLEVKVLGTKFNFRDYKEDIRATVTLVEGRVILRNLLCNESESILKPDEQAILDKKNAKIDIKSITGVNACKWTNGCLFFDEEKLDDIVKELQRSYNLKIYLSNDSLKNMRFYGLFIRQEQNIDEILDDLASTGKIQHKRTAKGIILY